MSSRSFALFFFAYFGYLGLLMPYISLWLGQRDLSAVQIAALMSTFQVSRIFGPFLWGWLADHLGQRAALLRVGAVLSALVFSAMFWLDGFTQLLLWLLLLNTLTAGIVPLGDAMVMQHLRGRDGGFDRHYGRVRSVGSFGFIVLTLAGGVWLEHFGIDSLPWLGLLMLGLLAVSVRVFRDAPSVESGPARSLRAQLARADVRWFLLSIFLMVFAHAAFYVFYSLHLEALGYSKTAIGIMWTVGVAVEIVFFAIQGQAFKRLTAHALLAWCGMAAAVRFLIIGHTGHVALLLFAQALHALTFAAHHSASIKLIERWFPGPLQARGQAIYASVAYGMGGTVGGLVMGWVWQHLGAASTFTVAAVAALGSMLAIRMSAGAGMIPAGID